MAELPSPPASLIPLDEASVYGSANGGSGGLGPLYSDAPIVQCEHCDKPILASALSDHHMNCEMIRGGGSKEKKEDEGSQGSDTASKKRKADGRADGSVEPQSKKKKTAKTTKASGLPGGKGSRQKGPLDPDKQCGVWIEKKGVVCTRSITCKVHSMRDKRMVQRSKGYDELVIEFRKLLDPNFVEPPKRETKAERKEKKDKERREQRERDIEAGLISRDAPLDDEGGGAGGNGTGKEKKKKKTSSKKKAAAAAGAAGANGAGGGASGSGAAGGSGGAGGEDGRGGGLNGEDDEAEDLDSEAEADALIEAVQRARGIVRPTIPTLPPSTSAAAVASSPITATSASLTAALNSLLPLTAPRPLGIPLALPTGASSFFVARNEALRCCADIVKSALGSGGGSNGAGGLSGSSGALGGGGVGIAASSTTGMNGLTNGASW